MIYVATIRASCQLVVLEIHGALSADDARRIACSETGAMPWNVTIEESLR